MNVRMGIDKLQTFVFEIFRDKLPKTAMNFK